MPATIEYKVKLSNEVIRRPTSDGSWKLTSNMPYRKEQFANGEIYHVILRGLDARLIFKDINDYYRGVFSIYEFNNAKPVSIKHRRELRSRFKKSILGRASDGLDNISELIEEDKRDRVVQILAFCFMPNHIHLLLRQIQEGGVQKFMVKLGSGYGRYFNQKYERKGYVFQNRFKSVHIKDDNQFKIVVSYIFTNPIALIYPGFKKRGVKDFKKVKEFLESYKWSSYQDYIGIKNFPSVTDRDFLLGVMGGSPGCQDAVENWIKHKEEINKFPEILLD